MYRMEGMSADPTRASALEADMDYPNLAEEVLRFPTERLHQAVSTELSCLTSSSISPNKSLVKTSPTRSTVSTSVPTFSLVKRSVFETSSSSVKPTIVTRLNVNSLSTSSSFSPVSWSPSSDSSSSPLSNSVESANPKNTTNSLLHRGRRITPQLYRLPHETQVRRQAQTLDDHL